MARRLRKVATLAGSMLVVLVLATTAAYAGVGSESNGYTWEDGAGKCVETYSTIGDNSTRYVKVQTDGTREQNYYFGEIACNRDWDRSYAYYRSTNMLVIWNGSSWSACFTDNWDYNSGGTNTTFEYEGIAGLPCGSGDYANFGYGQAKINGTWEGSYQYSGYTRWS
jgi:hypothetical protein